MTEFKPGDKVRYTGKSCEFFDHSKIGDSGTVVQVLAAQGDVRVQWDNGHHKSVVFADNLELVVDETPKAGDRVRLVHEGVVTGTSGVGSGRALLIDGEARLLGKGETVEILERAPKAYPVGTLVRSSHGTLAARTSAGHWAWLSDGRRSDLITDELVRRHLAGRIVHEPPQSA